MTNMRIGVVGCGNISKTYFELHKLFKGIEITACADINEAAANAAADTYKIKAMAPAKLIKHKDIDIVLNLTIPDQHFAVSLAAVKAGKHVYSEKPLTLSVKDGIKLRDVAAEKGVKVCCAPDTILGGSHQLARKAIDGGKLGKIVAGTCHFMGFGMEHWHPNPDFFFKPGGGPILDMGPYYIGNLINLIGPVKRVAALTSMARTERTISSQPRAGEKISVETPTNIHALLEFHNGATITVSVSWDVWAHRHANMELYGTGGSIYVPDPNFFGGEVLATDKNGDAHPLPTDDNPLAKLNQQHGDRHFANYRSVGLADLAAAVHGNRDAR
jgi:predicted dehydrogenase